MPRSAALSRSRAGGLVLAGLSAATGELSRLDLGHISGRSWLALLYLIGPGSLLAMTCYVIALRNLPTATVSTYAYVNPVVAVALGWLFLGERLTLVAMLGGAVVLVSVCCAHQPLPPGGVTSGDRRYSAASWSSRAR